MNWEKTRFFPKPFTNGFLGDVRWKRMLVLAKNLDHDEELVAATTGNNAPRFAEWESSQASRDPLDKCYKEKNPTKMSQLSPHISSNNQRHSLCHNERFESSRGQVTH